MHLLVCYLNKLQNARCNDKDSLPCSQNPAKFEALANRLVICLRPQSLVLLHRIVVLYLGI